MKISLQRPRSRLISWLNSRNPAGTWWPFIYMPSLSIPLESERFVKGRKIDLSQFLHQFLQFLQIILAFFHRLNKVAVWRSTSGFVRTPVLFSVVGSLVVVALSLMFMWRVKQVENGVCYQNNRVLTRDELRQAVLKSMVSINVEEKNDYKKRFSHDMRSRLGIVRNPGEFNIRTLIDKAYNNDRSFEENFSIEMIAPGNTGFDVNRLEEPFVLVGYSSECSTGAAASSGAEVFPSTDVRQGEPPARIKEFFKIGLYDRYRGFGRYYFRIKGTFIGQECCDNRLYRRSREEYLERKRKAYVETLESFARGIGLHDSFVAVSTCGEILTEKSDNGMDLDFIKSY